VGIIVGKEVDRAINWGDSPRDRSVRGGAQSKRFWPSNRTKWVIRAILNNATCGGIFVTETTMAELFSVNEAAAIAEISPETIRTALEKKSLTP